MKFKIGLFLIFLQINVFAFWWFFLPTGYQQLKQELYLYDLCKEQLRQAQKEKIALVRLLQQWETDPFLSEKYAREHLGMSRPGEEIVI